MIKIDIVSHCHCPPGVDQYAEMLRWQYASLIHFQPVDVVVRLVVCCSPLDEATFAAIKWIDANRGDRDETPDIVPIFLPPEKLFRRAIGRNIAAKSSLADVMWFTDVDYCFGPGCLQTVASLVSASDLLCQPATIWIHRDHATGDAAIERERGKPFPMLDFSEFIERRQKICIGGVQIVGGDTARRIGYLAKTKWVEPVDPELGFRSCRCDKAFRSINKLHAKALPIPCVFRLRHTRDGRDYTMEGAKVGKSVW